MRILRSIAALAVLSLTLALAGCAGGNGPYAADGYQTFEKDGALYVFAEGSEEAHEFEKTGKIEKPIRSTGGPKGMPVYGPSDAVIDGWFAARGE